MKRTYKMIAVTYTVDENTGQNKVKHVEQWPSPYPAKYDSTSIIKMYKLTI